MRPASARYFDTVRGSHQMVARARLCYPGQFGVNPTGVELKIASGDVMFDATADIRATLSLTVAEPWPKSTDSTLTALYPYGNEVFVERGVIYTNGVREWVALGYFRIYDVAQEDAPNGPITINGRDRMSGLVDGKVLAPQQYSPLTSVGSIVDSLATEIYPSIVTAYDFAAYSTRFGSSHIIEQERYRFMADIAASQAKSMYFGYDGALYFRSPPDPTAAPAWTINAGRNGVLTAASRSITREGVFNAVVASGETPGEAPPVTAVAYDLNPASPTYWYGSFGKVPTFFTSSFLENASQCYNAARFKIDRTRGVPYSVSFGSVPNPALEVLDPVDIVFAGGSAPERHVLETLRIPLTHDGEMTGTTRVIQLGAP